MRGMRMIEVLVRERCDCGAPENVVLAGVCERCWGTGYVQHWVVLDDLVAMALQRLMVVQRMEAGDETVGHIVD